jgi:DNA repair exonuclease SbcCD ATPase subunit
MLELTQIRRRLEQEKGSFSMLRKKLHVFNDEISELEKKKQDIELARVLIREVGFKTQEQLQYHISDITSLALSAVFEDPYELKVSFVQRRDKMECDLTFTRAGVELDPLNSSGYGAVDVASLALRVASWSMQRPRRRNTIILDEPLKYLSEDMQVFAGKMIKELSDKLGIQFIIVTHEPLLADFADRTFLVRQHIKTKKSKVTTYETN